MLLVLLTGLTGIHFIKSQSAGTYSRIQNQFSSGNIPTIEMVQGLLLLAAGLLLITPGVITDAVGILLLIPPLRFAVAHALIRHFKSRIKIVTMSEGMFPGGFPGTDTDIIDGEWEEEKPGK